MTSQDTIATNPALPETFLLTIEQAQRETPVCGLCASPLIPVARDGQVWLRCIDDSRSRSTLGRLLGLDFGGGHTRRLVIRDEKIADE